MVNFRGCTRGTIHCWPFGILANSVSLKNECNDLVLKIKTRIDILNSVHANSPKITVNAIVKKHGQNIRNYVSIFSKFAIENVSFIVLFCVAVQLFLDPKQSASMQGTILYRPSERLPLSLWSCKEKGLAYGPSDGFCSSAP